MLDIQPAEYALPEKEFNKHIDKLLETGQLNPDIIPHLDYKQQYTVNVIKKYYARQRYRERVSD